MTDKDKFSEIELVPELQLGGDKIGYAKFFGTAYMVDERGKGEVQRTFVYDPNQGDSTKLSNLQPGRWLLEVDLPSGVDLRKEVTIEPGESKTLQIREAGLDPLTLETIERAVSELKNQEKAGAYDFKTPSLLGILGSYSTSGARSYEEPSLAMMETVIAASQHRAAETRSSNIEASLTSYARKDEVTRNTDWDDFTLLIENAREVPRFLEQVGETADINEPGPFVADVELPPVQQGQRADWVKVEFGDRVRWVQVPREWTATRQLDAVPYHIRLNVRALERPVAKLYVHDRDATAILRRMTPAKIGEASILVEDATQWLFYKSENPLAAAAGGYVLLANKLHSEDRDRWFGWLDNLDHIAPWLPDAAILRGTLRLKGPSSSRNFDEAAQCFAKAFERGLPYYTLGVSWLQSGLDKLAREFPELNPMAERVGLVSRMVETSAVFTSLRG